MTLSPHFDWIGTKLAVAAATPERLKELASRKEAVALELAADRELLIAAITHARKIGLEVWGWIEVARDPGAAAAHPEWMHGPATP